VSALHIPDDGCCCAEDLHAVMQAAVDQMVGYQVFVANDVIKPTGAEVAEYTARVCMLLQNVLDDYAENHGQPDAYHAALAASHVVKSMRD